MTNCKSLQWQLFFLTQRNLTPSKVSGRRSLIKRWGRWLILTWWQKWAQWLSLPRLPHGVAFEKKLLSLGFPLLPNTCQFKEQWRQHTSCKIIAEGASHKCFISHPHEITFRNIHIFWLQPSFLILISKFSNFQKWKHDVYPKSLSK